MPGRDSLLDRARRRLAASRYLRDILWQASGNTIAQVIGIAIMPVLTRLYSPSDFAALNLFSQLVGGLAIVMTLRLEYLVMLPSEPRNADVLLIRACWLGVLHTVLLTPLLWALPRQWTELAGHIPFVEWLWLLPLTAWLVSLSVGLQQRVQRQGGFRTTGASEVVGRIAYATVAVGGALALPSIAGLMFSTAANAAAKGLWLLRGKGCRGIAWLKGGSAPLGHAIWRLAASTSVSNLLAMATVIAPMLFIGSRYGAPALGQYGLVISTLYLPSALIGQAIGQAYYQRSAQRAAIGEGFEDLLLQTTGHVLRIAIPLYLLIALVAPAIYPFVFGSEWHLAGEIAQWMCIAAATGLVSTPLDRTSLVTGTWWYLTAWQAARLLATLAWLSTAQSTGLTLPGCVAGLALVGAAAYVVDWIGSFVLARRQRHRSLSGKWK